MEILYEVAIEFGVVCNECGETLDAEFYKDEIIVDPCKTCLDKAREEAKNE